MARESASVSTNPRTILIWSTAPLPALRGDSVHILELAKGLAARGYQVHLLGELVEKPDFYTTHFPHLVFHQVRYLRGFWHVYQLIKKHQIELVHAYVYCFSEAGALGAKLAGVPLVIEVGDDPISCYFESRPEWKRYWGSWNERLAERWLRLLFQAADGVATLSRHLLDWYGGRYALPRACGVFPQAANLEQFQPGDSSWLRERLGFEPEDQIVHFAGSSAYLHGCHVLVESLPAVLVACPRARFVFTVGGEEARAEVQGRLQKLGILPQHVRVQGLPFQEMADMHRASDVCLAPHVNECPRPLGCSPKKMSEYMACGRPVLCSDIPELLEYGGDACEYFRAGDSQSLAHQLIALLQDPQRRQLLAEKGLARARQRYDAQQRIEEITRFYPTVEAHRGRLSWATQWLGLQLYRYWRGR